MIYIALIMGALVGFLTDKWLERAGIGDPLRLLIAVAVFALVFTLTANKVLLSF